MKASTQWIAEAIAAMPWVADPRTAVAIATQTQVVRLAPGEQLDLDAPAIVLEGEVALQVSGRHAHCARRGRVLGLDGSNGEVHQRVVALDPAVLLLLGPSALEDPFLQGSLFTAARRELERATCRLDHEVRNADEVVSSPGAELIPGPYGFDPMPVLYVVMQREPEAVAAMLPPGLRPIKALAGRYLVLVSDIQACRSTHPRGGGRSASYRELTVFIPCLGPRGRLGLYAPELFASATAPIMLGREIYGFPKRLGRIELDEYGASMACDGRLRFRARWQHTSALSGPAFSGELLRVLRHGGGAERSETPAHPVVEKAYAAAESLGLIARLSSAQVFVHKRIPQTSADTRLQWAIDQLVRIPFRGTGMRDAKRLDDLRVDLDPMPSLAGHVVAGYAVQFGFGFGEGVVVRDYLEASHQWRAWWVRS